MYIERFFINQLKFMKMKKIITTLLIAMSLTTFAQCEYEINDIDEFTEEKTIVTTESIIGKAGTYNFVYASFRRIGDVKALFVRYFGDVGCVTPQSYIIIKLASGETMRFSNRGKIKCKENAMMIFLLQAPEIDFLKSSMAEKIRISGSEKIIDIDIKQKEYFLKTLPCVE